MILRRFSWILLLLFLAGCASEPTNFYVLTQDDPGSEASEQSSQTRECIRVDLGPVYFPGYLDRSGIMTRVGPNRFRLSELHHWAEPLKENFVRILKDNLESCLRTEDAAVVTRPKLDADYRIQVRVIRFEPVKRQQAVLVAHWRVFRLESGEVICSRRADYRHSMQGEDYQDAVMAMSKATTSLSEDIARCLAQASNSTLN